MISHLLALVIFLLEEGRLLCWSLFLFHLLKNRDDNGDLTYMLVRSSCVKALCKYKKLQQNCRVIQMVYHLSPSGKSSISTPIPKVIILILIFYLFLIKRYLQLHLKRLLFLCVYVCVWVMQRRSVKILICVF